MKIAQVVTEIKSGSTTIWRLDWDKPRNPRPKIHAPAAVDEETKTVRIKLQRR